MQYGTVIISGIVQGVGFRPFLYNLLRQYPVTGEIQNTGNLGVTLTLKLDEEKVSFADLIEIIRAQIPPIAFIEDIKFVNSKKSPKVDYSLLNIIKSNQGTGKGLTLPPDIAVCNSCLNEFNDPSQKRFYYYPFIACAQCGPRFTIMKALPYDRPNSTVESFPFCEECEQDYNDFADRRFHAQTFNCAQCGPFYYRYEEGAKTPSYPLPHTLNKLVKEIEKFKIVGLKGIGGINLICRADNEDTVQTLRKRKRKRKNKAFAVMFPDIDIVKQYFEVTPFQEKLLTSFRRPIVILSKTPSKRQLPDNIAPGLPNVGVLLPYMGIHHWIFSQLGNIPIVFTSGNETSLPMGINNTAIINDLKNVADSIYLHNREIYQRCDDSVIRPILNSGLLIRRSRGYVPEYYRLPFSPKYVSIVGVGAELNSTGAISRKNRIFPTQHIGNVRNIETLDFLESSIEHLRNLLNIDTSEIRAVTHDLHPAFQSTRLAQSLQLAYAKKKRPNVPPILHAIQHHHAHLASLLVDNKIGLDGEIVTIAADGVGYGEDGTTWGGEILKGNYLEFSREGHIRPFPMIGGDLCAKYPDRMLISLLGNIAAQEKNLENIEKINKYLQFANFLPNGDREYRYLLKSFGQSPKNSQSSTFPYSSSFGRCLDAIAAGFGVCHERTYRGEPAMRLEGYIWDSKGTLRNNIDDYLQKGQILADRLIYDTFTDNLQTIVAGEQKRKKNLARSLVEEITYLFARNAVSVAQEYGLKQIGLTGGVAYNEIITKLLKEYVEGQGYQFLQHHEVAPGDAGISTGQIAIAGAKSLL